MEFEKIESKHTVALETIKKLLKDKDIKEKEGSILSQIVDELKTKETRYSDGLNTELNTEKSDFIFLNDEEKKFDVHCTRKFKMINDVCEDVLGLTIENRNDANNQDNRIIYNRYVVCIVTKENEESVEILVARVQERCKAAKSFDASGTLKIQVYSVNFQADPNIIDKKVYISTEKNICWKPKESKGKYTKYGVECLNDLCTEFTANSKKRKIPWLIRDRPEEEIDNILEDNGVMLPVKKYPSGDLRNPMNNNDKCYGLFFFAVLHNWASEPTPAEINHPSDYLPGSSYHGNRRIAICATRLLNDRKNLYFSDFFCFPARVYTFHNIQLVITTPGTEADDFCMKHLVKLDINDNPYLTVGEKGDVNVVCMKLTKVEVFYMDKLDLESELKTKDSIQYDVDGYSHLKGKYKDKSCSFCNIPDNEADID